MTPEEIDKYKKRHRFKPCKNKDDLHSYILAYLNIDVPDTLVDPDSNASPMDMIWEVYNTAIYLNASLKEASSFMFYAARAAFKTLSAAIIEFLMIVHAKRAVVHMAAIKEQAQKCQEYVKQFFDKPYFVQFKVGDNERTVEFLRYELKNSEGTENLTYKEWSQLSTEDQARYEKIDLKIEIAICTMAGSNSKHSTFMVVDEVDVVQNEKAYKQSKLIPDPSGDQLPITLYISTRKTSVGLVQRELDEAAESGLQVRHWNVIDVTEKCPADRHLPKLPKLPIYTNNDLKAISESDYNLLTPALQSNYDKNDGYQGCLQNCRMFAVCKGRLADQKGTSKLLKPVIATQGQFRKLVGDPDLAKAELMCWRPSSEGLIYPRLDGDIHVLSAAEMAEKITGTEYPVNFTKEDLLKLFATRKLRQEAGMDFGFTHNFSVVSGAIDGNRAFIFDVIEVAGLELPQQIQQCQQKLVWSPNIWPDPAYPSNIKSFHRAGFRMRKWKKGPDSVIGGIQIVRMKLRPPLSEPEVFFLKDEGVLSLVKKLKAYHKKQDAAGRWLEEPAKVDDDSCDAFRYLMMNVFSPKNTKIVVGKEAPKLNDTPSKPTNQQIWNQQVMEYVMPEGPISTAAPEKKRGNGRFFFSM